MRIFQKIRALFGLERRPTQRLILATVPSRFDPAHVIGTVELSMYADRPLHCNGSISLEDLRAIVKDK